MIQQSADAAQLKYDSVFVGLEPISLASGNSLEQNFPNPASGNTRVEFSLKDGGYTELSIYDISGKKIKVLLSEKLNGGKYSMLFDVRDLPAGIYQYSLSSGAYRNTLPITVVH